MDDSLLHMIEIMMYGQVIIVHLMDMEVNQDNGGMGVAITSTSTTTTNTQGVGGLCF